MTIFNDMQTALDSHLNTLNVAPVAWPNIKYEPTTTYLRPSFLPTDTIQAGMGSTGLDVTNIVYQIDVVTPKGSGRTTMTDDVANHFKRGTIIAYNGVKLRVVSVSIASALLDGAWYFVPVTVNLQTYTEAR